MFNSIKSRIIIVLFLVTSITFGLLSYYTSNRLKELQPLILQQYEEIADARTQEISNELGGLRYQIEMLAMSSVITDMNLDTIKPYLKSLVKQGRFLSFTISDSDGMAWTTYDETIDISSQQQYIDIITSNQASSISDPFFSTYGSFGYPIITISSAIVKNNETVGLINGVVTTEFIDNIIEDITLKSTGYGWIINNQGQLVAHPDKDITISDSLSSLTSLKDLSFLNETEGSFTFIDNQDTKMLGVFSTIANSKNWKLVLTINEEIAYAETTDVINTISIALLIAMLVLILLVLIYTHRLSKPILALKAVFEDAANGNISVKADEKTPNEIGDAAKSFNTMLTQIKQLTFVDPITGLNNYFSFQSEIPYLLKEYSQLKSSCYIVILSIENFKKFNTFYGYEFGNNVLKQLGKNISSIVTQHERVARYFSEEMILALCGKSDSEITTRAQEIITLAETTMSISMVEIKLTINCGISKLYPSTSLPDVIRQATLAKHKAKIMTHGNLVFYDQTIDDDIRKRQALEEALSFALLNNELYLLYQPVYNTLQQKIIGYEALLRWNHPLYKSIPIGTVIEIAETNGLINEIGAWVFEAALTKLSQLHKNDPTLAVSINVSPLQLISDGFLSYVKTIIKKLDVPTSKIIIEITENTTMLDVLDKIVILNQIRELGLSIAIDDFGTGYSSLNYLSQLPVDIVKIDKQFIDRVTIDNYTHTLIGSVVSIAKSLNLMVVAEGVETQEQLNELQRLGCTIIQGYLISKPINLED
jgi:diguanylate cyclase (GGDEF)-like protein